MKKTYFLILSLVIINIVNAQWLQMGSDINGEASDDQSGYSVCISSDGNIVAIGADENDGNGSNAGHVRVYEFSGGNWIQLGNDIDGEAPVDLFGRSLDLSSNGLIVAVGAYGNDDNGNQSGHVRIFEYLGSSWVQMGNDIDGESVEDWSGYSVSLSSNGNIVAIGATANDGSGSGAGHVRVYQYSVGNWIQTGNDIDGEAAYDGSGQSISLSSNGNIVAIGASGNDGNGNNSGHVRVYENQSGNWVQLGSDIDGEAANDGVYNLSLNDDGAVVAIGAVGNDGNGTDAGHVRVFEYIGGSWVQKGNDIDGEAVGDWSGNSVSLNSNGNIVAIGAKKNDGNGTDAGHVRVFEYIGGSWVQKGDDIDGEGYYDESGQSVCLNSSGNIVSIGAYKNNGNGLDAGHVRIFEYNSGSTPVSDFYGTPTSVAIGSNVYFYDLSSNSPTSWNWNFGDGNTSTTQNPIHVYNSVGTYAVSLTATNSFGSDIEVKTDYIEIFTGIEDIDFINSFSIYPNPTSKDITLEMEITKPDNMILKLYNLTGQLFLEENIELKTGLYKKTIDLSKYAKGVYTLQFISDEGIINRKILVE